MAHDGEVKASVVAETETRLNQATPALRKQIVLAATALAEASEGILKDELPEVAAIAADPKANEKDQQVAIYQTSSRLLRGWVALKDRTKGVSDHIEKHPAKYGILAAAILAIIAL